MMRIACLLLITCTLAIGLCAGQDSVHIPDPHLKAAIEDKLWVWDPTPDDMLGLTSLNLSARQIEDLTGLEYAKNLHTLQLTHNRITSLSPLRHLKNLRTLIPNNNQITSLSPLSQMTQLRHLNIHENQVSDLTPLSGMRNLEHLDLHDNYVGDLTGLADLRSLKFLDLHFNQIGDISALSALENLEYLDLCINRIKDISSLAGLNQLQTLNLYLNQISDIRPLSQLTVLESLHLHYNQITDISPLVHLTKLQVLELHNNPLSQAAFCRDLYGIMTHTPHLELSYSPHASVPDHVWAAQGVLADRIQVSWSEVCLGPDFAAFYRVFRADAPNGPKSPLGPWQTDLSFTDSSVSAGKQYSYWVQASISAQGEDAQGFAGPSRGWLQHPYSLTLGASVGGSVSLPGPGTLLYPGVTSVQVQAAARDADRYRFSHWTGTAVEAGRIDDPGQASSRVTVDDAYTLRAQFVSFRETLYVDDDGLADPGPGDARVSDPLETGTAEHPFDCIQEAIEVAAHGSTVIVRPGTYRENIDFLGKSILVQGLDPNGLGLPVIEGDAPGPVVTFTSQEDLHCRLTGFVITRGQGDFAGAIYCAGASPTLMNCLIVGNRALDPNGSAITCRDSQAAFVNCTIADNMGGEHGAGISLIDSDISLRNAIVWGNAPSNIQVSGHSRPLIQYCNVSDVAGLGNISVDPLFVQPGFWASPDNPQVPVSSSSVAAVWLSGDYHLRSAAGRWHAEAQVWLKDAVSSLCIDSGDPMTSIGQEPVPHGEVINLGAYGGTVASSKSAD